MANYWSPKFGEGNLKNMEIEIGGSGWRGWVDLVEAVCLSETSLRYDFMRNSKLPGKKTKIEHNPKSTPHSYPLMWGSTYYYVLLEDTCCFVVQFCCCLSSLALLFCCLVLLFNSVVLLFFWYSFLCCCFHFVVLDVLSRRVWCFPAEGATALPRVKYLGD